MSVIAVSIRVGDGKTTPSINLAVRGSSLRCHVLLGEADLLRRRSDGSSGSTIKPRVTGGRHLVRVYLGRYRGSRARHTT